MSRVCVWGISSIASQLGVLLNHPDILSWCYLTNTILAVMRNVNGSLVQPIVSRWHRRPFYHCVIVLLGSCQVWSNHLSIVSHLGTIPRWLIVNCMAYELIFTNLIMVRLACHQLNVLVWELVYWLKENYGVRRMCLDFTYKNITISMFSKVCMVVRHLIISLRT